LSAEQNAEIVSRGLEVLDQEGREPWYAYMERYTGPGFEFCPIIIPGVDGQPLRVDFAGVRRYLEQVNVHYPDFSYVDTLLEPVGENVVLLRVRIKASDPSVEDSPVLWAVFEFADGLVTRLYNYVDEEAARRHAAEAADA
jgi:hypothetical protein